MSTRYEPVGGKILIKPDPIEDKTASGLFIPDQGKERPLTATVVAVGPGTLNAQGNRSVMQVRPGDRVMYMKYAGTTIEIEGEHHVILSEHEIPLLIREENEPQKAKPSTGRKVSRKGRR